MRDRLIVDGKDLADFGVYLTNAGVYQTPEKDIEEIEIPGKSGNLRISKNRYKNVTVTYPCGLPFKFKDNFNAMVHFLCSRKGYCRIEDSFFPDFFREGAFSSPLSPKVSPDGTIGTFNLDFNCKPQRWMKEGEEQIEIESSGVILSPCLEDCNPLITIYGTGIVTINDKSIAVQSLNGSDYAIIDCELKNVYNDTGSLNKFSSGEFPVLKAGENEILTTARAEIKPRWWTL